MKEIVSPQMFGERKKRITGSEIKPSKEQKRLYDSHKEFLLQCIKSGLICED